MTGEGHSDDELTGRAPDARRLSTWTSMSTSGRQCECRRRAHRRRGPGIGAAVESVRPVAGSRPRPPAPARSTVPFPAPLGDRGTERRRRQPQAAAAYQYARRPNAAECAMLLW